MLRLALACLLLLTAPLASGQDLEDPPARAPRPVGTAPEPAPTAEAPSAAAPEPGPPRERAARERWLVARLDVLVAARPELGSARVGLAVDDFPSGRALYRRAGDQPFNVASNVKLVTTAAALALLGPEYRYRTQVLAEKLDASGTVTGNLYLRGSGDPSLDTAALWSLANELTLLGVKKVTGALVIDETFFDPEVLPPHFDEKNEDAPFRAPVGAVSLDWNTVTVRVQPGPQVGAPARIAVAPAQDLIVIRSTVTTVADGRTAVDAAATVTAAGTEIALSGQIRLDELSGEALRKRIDRPGAFTGAAFRALLQRAGIRITGKDVRFGAAPKAARAVASHTSEPVSVLVGDMMKASNNFMAEALLKTIGAEAGGAPGTWAKATGAVVAWLEDVAGLPRGGFRYENGSGLYDSSRFSPDQLVRVLRAGGRDFRTGPEYLAALALAGADGTLARRMRGTAAERYVRAKTGTLRNVSCLAGFAGGAGRPVAFAVLVNELPETGPAARAARSLEDDVAETLALFVEAGD